MIDIAIKNFSSFNFTCRQWPKINNWDVCFRWLCISFLLSLMFWWQIELLVVS